MKMPSIWKKAAVGLVCSAVLISPVVVSAQAAAPAPHAHATAPGGETATAPDFMAAMSKMQAEMQAMTMSGYTDHDFAMMMRRHHQGAIDMAKMELAQGTDKQMKQMAVRLKTAMDLNKSSVFPPKPNAKAATEQLISAARLFVVKNRNKKNPQTMYKR